MTIRHFTPEQLEEIGVPYETDCDGTAEELARTTVSSGRWNKTVRLVFRHPVDGIAYAVRYQQGLTEQQDCDLWPDDLVKAVEVEQRPVVVQQWKPVTAPRDPGLDAVLPAWEAMYEPGNVSDYLIGYANSEAAAKGAAEAWLRSQKDEVGRLEWVPQNPLSGYDAEFELGECHDDGVDIGHGITVRHRAAAPTAN
ncbi:hypothetical protein SAMN06272781_6847 [Streptomyces sp. 1222.2]|uniref:hypothetical protein n=1 Tax=Streptomyces sp. 1222.2 TaxID=1938833 RepID=UPI000BC6DCB9|nr:hypothetical protein [Streptomyces sp. 1222.2]SOD80059.1 hypothetical protein SAMN06272781_6847 [Streptomyces sp. 1222.2]